MSKQCDNYLGRGVEKQMCLYPWLFLVCATLHDGFGTIPAIKQEEKSQINNSFIVFPQKKIHEPLNNRHAPRRLRRHNVIALFHYSLLGTPSVYNLIQFSHPFGSTGAERTAKRRLLRR